MACAARLFAMRWPARYGGNGRAAITLTRPHLARGVTIDREPTAESHITALLENHRVRAAYRHAAALSRRQWRSDSAGQILRGLPDYSDGNVSCRLAWNGSAPVSAVVRRAQTSVDCVFVLPGKCPTEFRPSHFRPR
jgi:hypothetical protein